MEFSLAQSLEGYSEVKNVPFPHMKSDPAIDNVNPGLGQIVNLYDTIVPMRGHSLHSIEKKVDEQPETSSSDELKSQTGFGNTSLDSDILNSFQHPIVTDSIIFPKTEVVPTKTSKKKQFLQILKNHKQKSRKFSTNLKLFNGANQWKPS